VSLVSHLVRSKGWAHLPRRAVMLLRRQGVTPRRIMAALEDYAMVLSRYHVHATFPTTAAVFLRHPEPVQQLAAVGHEIALHGYHHVDHSLLTPTQQEAEVRQGQAAFASAGIWVSGFRAPYLRVNDSLLAVVASAGLTYDSSQATFFPVLDEARLSETARTVLRAVLDFYRPDDADTVPSLPHRLPNGLVEIPVSLPDDEILVDRLKWDVALVGETWQRMLTIVRSRNELLTLQLHPERALLCADALDRLLAWARTQEPPIWIATLAEVAAWWQERTSRQIEERWPGNAQGALAITGDLDALTLWDYAWRVRGSAAIRRVRGMLPRFVPTPMSRG